MRPHHHDEPTIPESVAEPAPAASFPPPRGLIKPERAYWRQFAPLLAGARVLTPADVETLADYCRACVAVDDRGRRLRTELRRKNMNNQTVRMLDSQLRGWIEKKTKIAGELGLTAVSRTRVAWSGHNLDKRAGHAADTPQQPKSKVAQLQEQAAALRRPMGVK